MAAPRPPIIGAGPATPADGPGADGAKPESASGRTGRGSLPGSARSSPQRRARSTVQGSAGAAAAPAKPQVKPKSATTTAPAKPRRARPKAQDPAVTWVRSLNRRRPGLVAFVLTALASAYGRPVRDPRLDPVSELVLTILSQNTADVNSERAFAGLRAAYPSSGPLRTHRVTAADGTQRPPEGWGGIGLDPGAPPDWTAVENAPLPELVDVIRPGGLGPQKAPGSRRRWRTSASTRAATTSSSSAHCRPSRRGTG